MNTAWTACGLLMIAHAACAGTIRLETAVLTHADAEEVSLLAAVRNTGDEEAVRIAVEGRLGTNAAAFQPFDLEPGALENAELQFPTPVESGLHVIELRIRYRDRNGYPFSTVAAGSVTIGGDTLPEPVAAHLRPAVIRDAGRLETRLRLDAGQAPRAVKVRYLLPDDLGCEAPDRAVTVFPGRPVTVAAALSNRTGRAGSVYPVFAVIREETAGGVLEHAVGSAVTLAGPEAGRFPWAGFGIAGAIVLALVFAIRQAGRPAGGADGA